MATTIGALKRQFAGAEFLRFDEVNGLLRVHVVTKAAMATVFLQGAHLSAWQPAGEQPVIFFSRKSELAPGKPLRGGVPIVFPWFAADKKKDRIDGHPGPSHGFARIEEWTLETAKHKGEDVELVFSLGPAEESRKMGFDRFRLTLTFVFGRTLTMRLKVTNNAEAPLIFEEGFHTYFHVTDIHEVKVSGLEATGYIDKVDNFTRKPPAQAPISFTQRTDRIYENTSATCVVRDGAARRTITMRKEGSNSTVVWNQFAEMPDLGPWDWHEMVAVEATNVESNAISLAPDTTTEMAMIVSVQRER